MKKILFIFCFLIAVFSSYCQCELSILDTVHVECYGEATGGFVLDVGSAVSPYSISLSNGFTQLDNPIFSNLSAENYQVIIVDANSCTDSVNVKIKQPPALNLSLQCEGVSLTASVIGGVGNYVYTWFDEINQLIGTDTMINFEEGNYYLFTVKDDNSCQKSDTVFVFASFEANTYLGAAPLYVEFQNTSSEGLYSWDFGDEGTSTQPNPFHDFTEIGGYEVVLTITDEQNECQSTFSDSIHVQGFEVEGELMDWAEMYNAFSPDGDGTNDEFTFLENHAIKDFKVIVYNRWGNKIYQWSDPKKGWDGKDKSGNPVKNGVYFYLMNATGENGKEYKHKGSLSLYR